MEPDISVSSLEDWSTLEDNKIDTIVDPMIVRSADLWLQGSKDKSKDVWEALSKNVDSIEAFFDALILSKHLPLVDYGITYDSNIGYEPESLYRRINEIADDKLLLNVHIMDEASKIARKSVIQTFEIGSRVDEVLAEQIKHELSAYDHMWDPDLSFLGETGKDEKDLARFQYGLLLFGHFASMAKAGHLIQSKRARLFTAGSISAKNASYEFDVELRNELRKIIESVEKRLGVMVNLDACPSFLPYLLSQNPKSTEELLINAIQLRDPSSIKEYRKWRRDIISTWQQSGKVEPKTERDLRNAAQKVLKEIGIDDNTSSFQFGINLFFVSAQAKAEKVLGWLPIMREGYGHAKILMRTIREAQSYKKMDTDLERLWKKSENAK